MGQVEEPQPACLSDAADSRKIGVLRPGFRPSWVTAWVFLEPVPTPGPRSFPEQGKSELSSQGLQSTQPGDAPLLPRLSPHWGLTRAGHTPGPGAVSRPPSSPPSPSPPRPPWSAPSTPSCSQSFCPGGRRRDRQRKRIKETGEEGEWREGKRGSRGVWLPSLPSLEEALQNTDNKNSCSRAKRKCHFYPGLVLGTTGATSPMGSGAGRRSGQEAGLRSTAWTPSPEGNGYEGPIGTSAQNFARGGNRGGSPAGAKVGQADEMGPERLAAEPLTQGCQGMQPGSLCQLGAGTGGAWWGAGVPAWAALAPSPTQLSLGQSP